jgi:diacylglycerol kinase (ATP)
MKLLKAFWFAFNGFKICLSSEINFRIHVVAAIVAAAAGICLKLSVAEWLVLAVCIALVLITEMINTAAEMLCDLFSKDFNPLVRKIKDTAAGAVLIAALLSVVCGALIFMPKLLTVIKNI